MVSHSYQRFFAYFLDFFIVAVISTFLTFWIPNSEKYESAYKEEMTVVSDYIDGKIEDKEFESIKMSEIINDIVVNYKHQFFLL